MRKELQRILAKLKPNRKVEDSKADPLVDIVKAPPTPDIDKIEKFITGYNPKKKLFLLWDFPEFSHNFYQNFFEDEQVFFINCEEEYLYLSKGLFLDAKNTSVFTFLQKESRTQASDFCKKYGIRIVYLQKGLIGHPIYSNLSACLFDNATNAASNFDPKALCKALKIELPLPLVKQSKELRALFCAFKIGRGGAPSFINVEKFLGPKLKKRVLILPQINSANNASSVNPLIKLAIDENPDSCIYIYKKNHPLAFKLLNEQIKIDSQYHNLVVITKAIRSTDLIMACDHIYTNHSLDAVDAIFYEKKLTVTGNPFYSGWGLTDDRTAMPRGKLLSVDEFFGILFFKCTRYCYDNHNPVVGLLSTLFDLVGSYTIQKALSAWDSLPAVKIEHMGGSENWPYIFNLWNSKTGEHKPINFSISTLYPLSKKTSYALGAALIGASIHTPHFRSAINALKNKMSTRIIIEVLQNYFELTHSETAIKEIANLYKEDKNWEKAYNTLTWVENVIRSKSQNSDTSSNPNKIISPQLYEVRLNLADLLIKQHRYQEAEELLYYLLLSGFGNRNVFSKLAEVYKNTFHIQDAIIFHDLALKFTDPHHEKFSVKHSELLYIKGDGLNLIESLCLGIKYVPLQFIQASSYRTLLQEQFGLDFPYLQCFFNASKNRLSCEKKNEDNWLSITYGHKLLQEPEKILDALVEIKNPKKILKYYLCKVAAHIQTGDYAKSREIIEKLIPHYPKPEVYREALQLALLMNDFIWAEKIFDIILQKSDEIIELSLVKRLFWNTNRLQQGFATFRDVEICNILKTCLKEKYKQRCSEIVNNRVLIVATSGIGDEIRVATLYKKMSELFPNKQICFTCEPRLLSLFMNSYPNYTFIPVARQRNLSHKTNLSDYNQLPNIQLYKIFDNNGWKFSSDVDSVTLTTDLLADVLKDKNSFNKQPYLNANPQQIEYWAKRIESSRIKIGLSWRSSLLSYKRSTTYLTIELLKPLLDNFSDKNVEFFNLQYDDASAELAWVETNCLSKITHFSDLDQFNDISSVAAFMSCLDLIISPPTSVIELAGAIGRPSFLLSNIGEMSWRKADSFTKRDIWSPSIIHIEGNECGDKVSLVKNLVQAVELFISYSSNSSSTIMSSFAEY